MSTITLDDLLKMAEPLKAPRLHCIIVDRTFPRRNTILRMEGTSILKSAYDDATKTMRPQDYVLICHPDSWHELEAAMLPHRHSPSSLLSFDGTPVWHLEAGQFFPWEALLAQAAP